ncbi:type II toxin-antitoxin system PemK/MazF family toxin [uncultured Lactobacillus sp.]|uniref:type II toxin-antitoxin system PemK/MazF family toxin n=1 Tax=uncultured Lactobacillus sp. TaxID=153152 RepID=UPI0028046CBC|nr:type II toxin-antitoxin system PemK/MazF family toxin [uncultured Lactobacillus sp.]
MTRVNYPKQGDLVFMDAEPHSGHEIGGHDPKKKNIRRPFLIMSQASFNQKTGMCYAMAITSKHRARNTRLEILDFASKIHGDLLLYQVPEYDFISRNCEIVGHIKDEALFNEAKEVFLQIFQ